VSGQFLGLFELHLKRAKDAFIAVVLSAPAMIVLSIDSGRSPLEEVANDAALYVDESISARTLPVTSPGSSQMDECLSWL
jgi:hypothetical protein